MIFNPLFFNENGNNQLSVSQPNKLKNNKYLFSDIVKIVMNTKQNQNKLFESELELKDLVISQTPQLKFSSTNPEITQQLKFDFISNSENEKVKTELADILPDDMAKLLVDDMHSIEEKKIISYVGKEPLNEELKQFLTNLIGSDLIEKHVNNETGLILNLEDSKSAVNIELTKEYSSNNNSDKIIVQTLLVPQKSKLQSLLDYENKNVDRNLTLFAGKNIAQSKKQILENIKTTNTQIKEPANENIINKPTLSVYSFKYNANSILKENEPLNELIPSVYNIKDVKSDQNEIIHEIGNQKIKTPLAKISFIPSSIKSNLEGETEKIHNFNKSALTNKENKSLENYSSSFKSSNNLKLFESKSSEAQREINVTKITIMKKHTNELIEYQNKFNIKNNEVDAELRRIDFKNLVNKSTTSLRILKNLDQKNTTELNKKFINYDIKENINLNKHSSEDNAKSKSNAKEIKQPINSERIIKSSNEMKQVKSNSENQRHKNIISENNTDEKLSTVKEKSNSELKQPQKVSEHKNSGVKNNTEIKVTEKNIVSDSKSVNINKDLKLFSRKINIENPALSKKEIPNQIKTNDAKEINDEKKKTTENKIVQSDESKSKRLVNDKANLTPKENIKNIEGKDTTSKTEVKINDVKLSVKTNIEQITGKEINDKNGIKLNINNDDLQNLGKKEETKINHNKIELKENINKSELKNEKLLVNELTQKSAKDESVNSNKENLNNVNSNEINKVDETENDNKVLANQKENVNDKTKIKTNDENQIINKELTLKIKGEVKSVNHKVSINENQNTASDGKINNSNTEGSLDDDQNSTSKQNLKSNKNLELKEKSESIFTKELKNEGIKQNNFVKIPTEEMKNENSNRIVKSIEVIKELTKFITKQEEGTLSFNIKPEKLGQLKITLETINNSVRASIEVENEQAKQLIERNINQLYKQLNQNEVQLSSLNISLSNPKKENAAKNHKEEFSKNESPEFTYDTEEKTEKKSRSLGYNTYEYLA